MRAGLNLLLFLTAAAAAPAAGPMHVEPGRGERYSGSFYCMGTLFEITVPLTVTTGRALAGSAADSAFATIARLDALLSTYKPYSEISRINRCSGGEAVKVHPSVIAVLDSSLAYWKITDGAFDITVGPLLDLWGFKTRRPGVPEAERVDEALSLVGISGVDMDREREAVRLKTKGQSLDLGGIGKGFALDRAADVLKAKGIVRAMLNAGGNLLFMGESAPGQQWRAGVADPRSPGAVIAEFGASDVAVSTSGDYENYFISGGVRYSHILDPRTGRPARGPMSVTVIAPSATGADALSTAIVVMGRSRGLELVESLANVEALIVTGPKGGEGGSLEVTVSSGLRGKVAAGPTLLTSPGSRR